MTDDLKPTRLVYLGTCVLEGNKPGTLWASEAMAATAADTETLRKCASPFGKGRGGTPVVGGVYEMGAQLSEYGRPTRIQRPGIYRTLLQTDAVTALALAAKGRRIEEEAQRAEAKAKRLGPAHEQLEHLAHIIAAADIREQEHIIRAFSNELRQRSLQIWRNRRKATSR